MKKKLLLESTIVSLSIIVISIFVQVIGGITVTTKNVPDIVEEYPHRAELQSTISFGYNIHFDSIVLLYVLLFILIAATYYCIRTLFKRLKK